MWVSWCKNKSFWQKFTCKVYTNEDEEEEGLSETESALSRRDNSFEDVKSGLINESEQCKDARTGDQLAFASKSFYFWKH